MKNTRTEYMPEFKAKVALVVRAAIIDLSVVRQVVALFR
jgi:hypothetical protein